jgi:hypothetical protein
MGQIPSEGHNLAIKQKNEIDRGRWLHLAEWFDAGDRRSLSVQLDLERSTVSQTAV